MKEASSREKQRKRGNELCQIIGGERTRTFFRRTARLFRFSELFPSRRQKLRLASSSHCDDAVKVARREMAEIGGKMSKNRFVQIREESFAPFTQLRTKQNPVEIEIRATKSAQIDNFPEDI